MPTHLAVDANCLISALLGGRAREIIFSGQFALHSPQSTLFEVVKHLPWLAKKLGESEAVVFRKFELLPIIARQPDAYLAQWQRAEQLIGMRDPLDIPLLALALMQSYSIWSNDRDFEGIEDVEVVTTADLLLRLLEAP